MKLMKELNNLETIIFLDIDDDYSHDIKEYFPLNGVEPSEPEGFNEECFQKAIDILA